MTNVDAVTYAVAYLMSSGSRGSGRADLLIWTDPDGKEVQELDLSLYQVSRLGEDSWRLFGEGRTLDVCRNECGGNGLNLLLAIDNPEP